MIHIIVCSNSEGTRRDLTSSLLDMEQKLKVTLDVVTLSSGGGLIQLLLRQRAHHANQAAGIPQGENEIYNKAEYVRTDLLFLDVELPDINGIEVADFIRNTLELAQLQIVFMADSECYAMSLFPFQPLDFRIKPLKAGVIETIMKNYLKNVVAKRISFVYKKEKYYKQIPYQNIMYFISESRKIKIVCQDHEDSFYGKLCHLTDSLPSEFIQIHKSYIINCRYVQTFHSYSVTMVDKQTLNISRPYRELMKRKMCELKI